MNFLLCLGGGVGWPLCDMDMQEFDSSAEGLWLGVLTGCSETWLEHLFAGHEGMDPRKSSSAFRQSPE